MQHKLFESLVLLELSPTQMEQLHEQLELQDLIVELEKHPALQSEEMAFKVTGEA